MNANELADELEEGLNEGRWVDPKRIQAATMLRQQQAEIEALKKQLQIVSRNLHMGISKSIQKFQAKCIDEVLNGDYE